jgi:hypothetical protein
MKGEGSEKGRITIRPSPLSLQPKVRMWHYWGFRAALWLTARVPRWLGYRVAALGGELYFWLNPGHSHKAVENYAVILAPNRSSTSSARRRSIPTSSRPTPSSPASATWTTRWRGAGARSS